MFPLASVATRKQITLNSVRLVLAVPSQTYDEFFRLRFIEEGVKEYQLYLIIYSNPESILKSTMEGFGDEVPKKRATPPSPPVQKTFVITI
ncbi:MAG: element excision factor XisH family protein [Microcoleaceae cyanobacterium]